MTVDLLRAAALMLIFEGILPFVAPSRMRGVYGALSGLSDRALRRFGLFGMLAGLAVLQYLYWTS